MYVPMRHYICYLLTIEKSHV